MNDIIISMNQLDSLDSYISSAEVSLTECNADYITCPLCGASEPYLYTNGHAITNMSMSSIVHDEECPYEIIRQIYKDNLE